MVIYYFNTKLGRRFLQVWTKNSIEDIDVLESDNKSIVVAKIRGRDTLLRLSGKEGKVYKKAFWLHDLDYERADQIIDGYYKELVEKAKQVLKNDQLSIHVHR